MADITKIGTFIQSSPHPAWLATAQGHCVYVNPALERLTGLNSEETEQADWRSFLCEEDRGPATASWQGSLTAGAPYRVRVSIRGIDGIATIVDLIAVGHKVDDGTELWLFIGLVIDAASQEQTPSRVPQLQATLNVIPAYAWYALPSGALAFLNERTADYVGLPKDHPLRFGIDTGAAWDSHIPLLHPDDHEDSRRVWSTCLRTGCAGEVTFRVRNGEGGYRWFLSRAEPLLTSDGTVLYWVGVNLDIDDAKRAEQALQRSEAYLAEAERLSRTGSWAWSPVSDNRHYSEECYRVLGFAPGDGTPPPLETVIQRVHPEDQAQCREQVEKAIRDKGDFELHYRIVHPDKRVRNIHCVGHSILDGSGDLVEFVGTVIDVTERKSAEREREKLRLVEADLAHTNRVSTLGEMAASLAHEIKQPIAAAITSANSCIEWLAHEPPNLDRARAAAARIDKYGNRAAEIIDRIRSFYKKSLPQRELVDVNGIILEILTLLDGEANRSSVAVRTELAADLPEIMADRVQLQQVFMNLILNAIEAMRDEGGELTVKSQRQDGQLLFSVIDTGPGLPVGGVDEIFSAFFTTKPQGSGMGLAISRSIVESHGGRLWAAANDGRGATFNFTLPTQVTESSPLVGLNASRMT